MFLEVDLKCPSIIFLLPASGGIFVVFFWGGISLFRPTWYELFGGGWFRAGKLEGKKNQV